MNFIAKTSLAVVIAGVGATMYAAPGGTISNSAAAARAATIRSEADADFRRVVQLQAIARREKDVIKLNCVNDKLVQLKAELNVADRLQTELQVTRESGDPAGGLQALMDTARQIHVLREGAEQCIGEHLLLTESANAWTHPDLPDNPGANEWGTAMEPPAYASPIN